MWVILVLLHVCVSPFSSLIAAPMCWYHSLVFYNSSGWITLPLSWHTEHHASSSIITHHPSSHLTWLCKIRNLQKKQWSFKFSPKKTLFISSFSHWKWPGTGHPPCWPPQVPWVAPHWGARRARWGRLHWRSAGTCCRWTFCPGESGENGDWKWTKNNQKYQAGWEEWGFWGMQWKITGDRMGYGMKMMKMDQTLLFSSILHKVGSHLFTSYLSVHNNNGGIKPIMSV